MNKQAALDYVPRKAFIPFHQRSNRFAVLVCHRRAGKSFSAVHELLIRALYTPKKNGRYAYIAPLYRQARDIAWSYLKEAARPFVTSEKEIRESELRVRLVNGSWITLYGSDNPDSLRGLYFDGVILDEFGDCRPSLWTEVVLPTLADRHGWAVFSGTPRGLNHFYKVAEHAKKDPDWFFMDLRASTSGLLSDATLKDIQSQLTPEQYRQEFENDFRAAVEGTYYASIIGEMEASGHIKSQALYDPNQPVNVACDLGYSDSTAFWFWQTRPDGIAIIDHYENAGKALPHYFQMLDDKPYTYDTIWLPHDSRAKTLQTGRSTIEQFVEHMADSCRVSITPNLSIQHGIDAARLVLRHCYFAQDACTDGIEALRAYKRQYNEVTKAFSDKPLHDWSSHSSDAFRYLSLIVQTKQKFAPVVKSTQERINEAVTAQTGYHLEELFKDHERQTLKTGFVRMRV